MKKEDVSGKPKPCIFFDELDQIYWKDSEPTLKNAVVGKDKKNLRKS